VNTIKLYRALTKEEYAALATYEKKCATVRDKIRAAVYGTKLGCIIWGEGGIGKSFQVEAIHGSTGSLI
jgi:transcriptional regulator with AAA-type ATPase domain